MLDVARTAEGDVDWEGWDGGFWRGEPEPEEKRLTRQLDKYRSSADNGKLRARFTRSPRGPRRLELPPLEGKLQFSFSRDGKNSYRRAPRQITLEDLVLGHPMRDFSRARGQRHKPVALWTHTNKDLVACESQNERRFVVLADYDRRVRHIVAQPFTIQASPGGVFELHTPDMLVFAHGEPPMAVNCKLPDEALEPENIELHNEVAALLSPLGIGDCCRSS